MSEELILYSDESLAKAIVLAHYLSCVLYQPHAMGNMVIYGGAEGIEGLHRGLHSDDTVIRESPFGHLWYMN